MNLKSHYFPRVFFAVTLAAGLVPACWRVNAAPIPTGLSHFEVGSGTNAITVYTYKPKDYQGGPLVMVFHGVTRDAKGYCRAGIPIAERYHVIIAAPLFDTNRFDTQEYQRGGVMKEGVFQPPEDWTYLRLPAIIQAVREAEGNPNLPYYFIGHSGGGQFVMRLAALYPMEAKRIVACNPGSDLFPRRDWKYGYGFGGLPENLSDDAALQHYLAAPLTLCLGLNDTVPQHPELDRTPDGEREGPYRLERGLNCFSYAQKLAQAHGWQFNWHLVRVPGVAHDAKGMFASDEVQKALMGADRNTASIIDP